MGWEMTAPVPAPEGLRANQRGDGAPARDPSPTSRNWAVASPRNRRVSVTTAAEKTEVPSFPTQRQGHLNRLGSSPFLRVRTGCRALNVQSRC